MADGSILYWGLKNNGAVMVMIGDGDFLTNVKNPGSSFRRDRRPRKEERAFGYSFSPAVLEEELDLESWGLEPWDPPLYQPTGIFLKGYGRATMPREKRQQLLKHLRRERFSPREIPLEKTV